MSNAFDLPNIRWIVTSFLLVFGFFCVLPSCGLAQTWSGLGDGLTWGDPLNWSGSNVPDTSSESATIGLASGLPASVLLQNPVTVRQATLQQGAQLTLNAVATMATFGMTVNQSTLTLNSNLVSDNFFGTTINSGTLNLNAGTLSGSLYLNGGSTVNRNGGLLSLSDLKIDGATSIVLDAADSLTKSFDLKSGGSLAVNRNLSLTNTSTVDASTLNLNANLAINSSFGLNISSGTVNHNSGVLSGKLSLNDNGGTATIFNRLGGTLNLTNLTIDGATSIAIGAADNLTTSLVLSGGATATVNRNVTLAATSTIDASTATLNGTSSLQKFRVINGGILNLNGATTTTSFGGEVTTNATLNLNANLTVDNTFGLDVSSGTVNHNSGVLSGKLNIDDDSGAATVFNRLGGTLNLTNLAIDGATSITIGAADNVTSSLSLSGGATATINRALNLNTSTRSVSVVDSVLNLNQNVTSNTFTLSGVSSAINRTGGSRFITSSLNVQNGAAYVFNGTDSISSTATVSGGSVMTVNQLLNVTQLEIEASTLNLNQNVNVTRFDMDNPSATINRTGNARISGSTLNVGLGATYNFSGGDQFSSTMTVSGGSTVNLNQAMSLSGTASVTNSTLNLNQNLTTSTLLLDGAVFNRTGAARLTTNTLNLANGVSYVYANDDSVSSNLNLTGNSVFEANKAVGLSGSATVDNSTLRLNQNLSSTSLVIQGAAASIVRAGGARFLTSSLTVQGGGAYIYNGVDSISNNLTVGSGTSAGTFSSSAPLALSGSFNVLGGSTATLNSSLSAGGTIQVSNSTFNLAGNLSSGASQTTTFSGGSLILNSGTISGRLSLGNTTLNRSGGVLSLTHLTVTGSTPVTLLAGDSISQQITLNSAATLTLNNPLSSVTAALTGTSTRMNVLQRAFNLTGLSLNTLTIGTGSRLNIVFDTYSPFGLDWGLRLNGDVRTSLQSMLTNGRLTFSGGNGQSIGLIYDNTNYGNYTYLGYVSVKGGKVVPPIARTGDMTAVPEPGALCLLAIGSSVVASCRRRSVMN